MQILNDRRTSHTALTAHCFPVSFVEMSKASMRLEPNFDTLKPLTKSHRFGTTMQPPTTELPDKMPSHLRLLEHQTAPGFAGSNP